LASAIWSPVPTSAIRDGQAVEHVSVSQNPPSQFPPGSLSFQHLTRADFFLDSNTFLPSAITFNVHPDNDAGLDIPIEVRFFDYRAINGAQVPYHVQKYLNNSLTLDFQTQSVIFNSGITAGSFSL
jgi:hypothetical protein